MPIEEVDAPCLTQDQAGWGSEYLIKLFSAKELDWMAFKHPFQFKQFYDFQYNNSKSHYRSARPSFDSAVTLHELLEELAALNK